MEISNSVSEKGSTLSESFQENPHHTHAVLEESSSVVENDSPAPDSDDNSVGTLDYSVDGESDKEINKPYDLNVNTFNITDEQSGENDMYRLSEVDDNRVRFPINTKKHKNLKRKRFKIIAQDDENMCDSDQLETNYNSMSASINAGNGSSDDTIGNGSNSRESSSEVSGHSRHTHVSEQDAHQNTKRPKIILKLQSEEKVKSKRRPRKSKEPKRVILQYTDLQTNENETNQIDFGKTEDNDYFSAAMLKYTNEEQEGMLGSDFGMFNDNEANGSDTDFMHVSENISHIEGGDASSGGDYGSMKIVLRKKKERKQYLPKDHGVELPDPILVDSQDGEPPKLLLPCKECGRNCKNKASYIAHYKACSVAPELDDIELVNGKRPCKICGKLYELKTSLRRHMRIHLGLVEYKCEVCGKQFADAKSLRGHFLIHTGEKPFKCSFCGFQFRDKSTLRKHEIRHGTERPFGCEVCGKRFFLGVDLRKHLKIHDAEKEFKCNQCDKQFYLIAQLKRHLRVHSGERPYECQYCGRFFTDQTSLKHHIVTHTGIKPHQCDLCGATFTVRSRLTKHIMRHNNDRPFACNLCERRFIQNAELKAHLKMHRGERNYQCLECGKAFVESSHLWKHKQTHSPVKKHSCSFCGKGLRTLFTLKRHWMICKRKKIIDAQADTEAREASEKGLDSSDVTKQNDDNPPTVSAEQEQERDIVSEGEGPETSTFDQCINTKASSTGSNNSFQKGTEVLISRPPEISLKNFLHDAYREISHINIRNEKLPAAFDNF